MPVYEYECLTNGHVFEVRQRISDAPLTECQVCREPVRRLISNTSFVLKGGGWYAQAYSGSSQSKTAPAKTTDKATTPAAAPASTSTTATTTTSSTTPSKKSSE